MTSNNNSVGPLSLSPYHDHFLAFDDDDDDGDNGSIGSKQNKGIGVNDINISEGFAREIFGALLQKLHRLHQTSENLKQ